MNLNGTNGTNAFLPSKYGIKFGSGSAGGSFVFNTSLTCVKVTAEIYEYNKDNPTVYLSDNTEINVSNHKFNDSAITYEGPYNLELVLAEGGTSFKIYSPAKNQRFYLASLTFEYIPA